MQPRRAFSPARAAAQTRIVPLRLMSTTCSKASGSSSAPRRMMPAQLTTTSSSPRAPTQRGHRRRIAHVQRTQAMPAMSVARAGGLRLGLGGTGGMDHGAGGGKGPRDRRADAAACRR